MYSFIILKFFLLICFVAFFDFALLSLFLLGNTLKWLFILFFDFGFCVIIFSRLFFLRSFFLASFLASSSKTCLRRFSRIIVITSSVFLSFRPSHGMGVVVRCQDYQILDV